MVARVLTDLRRQGLRKVHFSGGEVLLRPDLETIIRQAVDLGLQVNITTNGTLLEKEQAAFWWNSSPYRGFFLDEASEKKQ